jgi:ferritin-like protein
VVIRQPCGSVDNSNRTFASGPKETPMTDSNSGETGAVAQLAKDDLERKKFLKMAGRTMGAGAAATALGAFIAACGSSSSSSTAAGGSSSTAAAAGSSTTAASASTSSGSGDLAIVNYALTLEYLEDEFYDKVIHSGLFHGSSLSTLKTFGAEEHQHVLALKSVAGKLGTPAPKPKGKFPLQSAASVVKLAATVENIGAAAYLGQAANIQSKEILAAALSIHTVEARHAATLNAVLKMSPTPDGAFAGPMSMAQVLAAVKPFIA